MRLFLIVFMMGFRLLLDASTLAQDDFKQTSHSITVNDEELAYTATTGTLPIYNELNKPIAEIFFVSYTKENSSLEKRPITFVFNGGPGSSSVWLHMGALGPKRIHSFEENKFYVPPYELSDNEETILDYSDLVFIDAIETGFSHVAKDETPDKFFEINADAKSIGDFICQYLTTFNRWQSLKYIAGESYGTIRAICVANYLHDTYGIFFNGLALISPVINLSNHINGSISDHLSYALILPSYAATAWYHNLLDPAYQEMSLKELISHVQSFALNEYVLALIEGDSLIDSKKQNVINDLSKMIGICSNVIEEKNLRIDERTFLSELLLKDKSTDLKHIIGVHDTRIKGYANNWLKENPSLNIVWGSFSAIINSYIRNDLEYSKNEPYNVLNYEANRKWKWNNEESSDPRTVDLSNHIRYVFITNPDLKIFVASGYYDLATPFMNAIYDINHLHLPTSYRDKIQHELYEGGHMFYLSRDSHKKLKKDLKDFFQ